MACSDGPWGVSAAEKPRGEGFTKADAGRGLEEGWGEADLSGDVAGWVRGVSAAAAEADMLLLLRAAWALEIALALKTEETVLARELVEPMPFSMSPESRASESEEDVLATTSGPRTRGGAMSADFLSPRESACVSRRALEKGSAAVDVSGMCRHPHRGVSSVSYSRLPGLQILGGADAGWVCGDGVVRVFWGGVQTMELLLHSLLSTGASLEGVMRAAAVRGDNRRPN